MKSVIFILIIFSLNVQADNAYKCIQGNGQTIFSDSPCPTNSTEEIIGFSKVTWQEIFIGKLGKRASRAEIKKDNEDTIIKLNVFSVSDLNNTISLIRKLSGENVHLLKLKIPRGTTNGTAILHVTKRQRLLASDKFRTNNVPVFERRDIEINKILRTEKGSLYAVYNKELQKKPKLKGEVLFNFGISPEGIVFDAKVKSNTNDPSFENKLLDIIRNINFGSKQVASKYIEWSIEFLSNENS